MIADGIKDRSHIDIALCTSLKPGRPEGTCKLTSLLLAHLSPRRVFLDQIQLGPYHHHIAVLVGIGQEGGIVWQVCKGSRICDIIGKDGRLCPSAIVRGYACKFFLTCSILIGKDDNHFWIV